MNSLPRIMAGMLCALVAISNVKAETVSGLSATVISPTQIAITWTASPTPVQGYVVERRRSGKPDFQVVGQTPANITTFKDAEARQDTKFYYRVAAKLPSGNGAFCEPITVVTPMELPAAPINLITQIVSGKQVNVMWTDTSHNEGGFILERKTGVNGTYAKVLTADPDQTDFQDKTIPAPGAYVYRVKAFNNGGESAYSNEYGAQIKPGEKPRISPWVLARGFTKHLNLQITGESGKWLLTDTSNFKLEDGYEWWYFVGGKIIKTKTPLKNEPWNGNHPGRLLKMAGKTGLETFNKWESRPEHANYYFDLKAGMTMDGKSGGVVVFLFK